jgi:hypothetical protein
MTLRSRGGNGNKLKELLLSHEARKSGSSSLTMARLRSFLLLSSVEFPLLTRIAAANIAAARH